MSKNTQGYKSDIFNTGAITMSDLPIGAMSPRPFSSGSVGFNHSGKASIKCGEATYQFQVGLNVTLQHSKPEDPKWVGQEKRNAVIDGAPVTLKDLGLDWQSATARVFSSGKAGFYLNAKVYHNGGQYQVGCSIVAVGSDAWDDQRPEERASK